MARSGKSVPITPSVLEWAIQSSGIDDIELAGRLHIKPAELDDWTHGRRQPSLTQFRRLAEVLQRPAPLFLLPRPPDQQIPSVAFRHAVAGSRDQLTANEIKYVREAARLQRALSWVRSELGNRRVDLPTVGTGTSDQVAQRTRRQLNVPIEQQLRWKTSSEALRAWRGALEATGVHVFLFPLGSDSARGFSLWDDYAPVVAINTHWNTEARIFTAFHEVGHLTARSNSVCLGVPIKRPRANEDASERWCERFAADVLMPWPAVLHALRTRFGWAPGKKITELEQLRTIARAFKVSQRAAAIRLIERQVADWSLYESIPPIVDDKSGGGGGGGRNRQQLYEDMFGTGTARMLINAVEADLLTRSDALGYLKVSDSDLYALQESLQ